MIAVRWISIVLLLAASAARADEESAADRAALDAALPNLTQCYMGNVASIGMQGDLTLRLSVSSKGVVTQVKLVKANLGMPRYHNTCVVERVHALRLPVGAARSFTHTFVWRRPDPFANTP